MSNKFGGDGEEVLSSQREPAQIAISRQLAVPVALTAPDALFASRTPRPRYFTQANLERIGER